MSAPAAAIARAVGWYFLAGFVTGFAFGTVRVFALEPWAGKTMATLIELPVVLGILWLAAGAIVRRCALPAGASRWIMGAAWFALFLAAEFALGFFLRGWRMDDTLAHFLTAQGALGLLGFLLAAAFPALRGAAGPGNRSGS